jgi:DNA-directed RNA polymerase subunit RPC12/RpoP
VTHEAAACRHCGAAFSRREATGGVRLPERLIELTEHRGLVYACACCGKPTRAALPEGVTGLPNMAIALGRAISMPGN